MPAELAHADLLFEEDILRNAYSLKYWWRYLEAKSRAPPRQRNQISERALKYLPGSYKLWHAYLADRRDQVKLRRPGDAAVGTTPLTGAAAARANRASFGPLERAMREPLPFVVAADPAVLAPLLAALRPFCTAERR